MPILKLADFTDVTKSYAHQYQYQFQHDGNSDPNNSADPFVTFALLCKLNRLDLHSLDIDTSDAQKFDEVGLDDDETNQNMVDFIEMYFPNSYRIYQVPQALFDDWATLAYQRTGLKLSRLLRTANYYHELGHNEAFVALPKLTHANLVPVLNSYLFGGSSRLPQKHSAIQTLLGDIKIANY